MKKELCNPLEFILLDNQEKMEDRLKKYGKEHYKLTAPYKKAQANLQKHKKRAKGGIQNPKELQVCCLHSLHSALNHRLA